MISIIWLTLLMEKLLTELGVDIIKGTEVKKIDHKDGQVK